MLPTLLHFVYVMFGSVSQNWTSGPLGDIQCVPEAHSPLLTRAVCSRVPREGCIGPVHAIHKLKTMAGLLGVAGPSIHLVARPCLV